MSGVKGSLISTSASSSSRLSPLARPFTIKTSSRHENVNPSLDFSSQGYASGVDHPFSQLSLDAHPHHAYHSDATAIAVVPFRDYTSNSYFKDCSIEEYPIQTDFTCHTSESPQSYSKNDLLNLGNVAHDGGMVDIMTYGVQGRASDQEGKGRMPFKERTGVSLSMSSNTRPEQGKLALERLQHSGETPSALHGKGNLTMTESNQNRSKDTDRINPKSSLPPSTSEMCSVASGLWPSMTLHDTQGCLSYPNPVTLWSYCDSNIIPKERYPPNIDSYGSKPTVSNAPPYYSSPPLVFKPSVTSIKPSTFDPVSVVNVDSGGSGAITKIDDHSGYPGSRVEAYGLHGQKDGVACHEQITVEKVKGRKSSEPVCNEAISPLAGGKSKLQVVVPSVANDLTLEPQDSKSSVTINKPSTQNVHNDSDLDSPCWKGRQAYQSPFQVSESLNSQLSKDETVRRNSLNPLAPQFFPGKAKRNVDNHQGEHHGYNSFSFQQTTALAVAVSSREDRLMSPVRAETYLSEVSSVTVTQRSNDVLQSGKELCLFNKSNRSSLLNASCSSQPYIVDDYNKADSLLVTDQGANGFVEGVNDTVHDVSGSPSFHVAESLNSPSSRVDVFSSFAERFQGLSKSKPNIDNELLINAMHDLSKLLLLNCSNVDSLNESERDKVQNIINNLYVYVRNRVGQRAPMPDSGHLSNSFGTLWSADHHKEMLDSFSQSRDAVLERGEHVTQIVDKARKENQGIGEHMHPEALMYRNLWLETASALSFIKSKHKAYL